MVALGLQKPEQLGRSLANDMMSGAQAIGDGIFNGLGMFLDNLTAQVRGMGKKSVGEMFDRAPSMDPKFSYRAARGVDIEAPRTERKPKEHSLGMQRERGISQEQAQKFDGMLSKYGMDKASLQSMMEPNRMANLSEQQQIAQMKTTSQPMRFEVADVEGSFVSSPPMVGAKRQSQHGLVHA